MGYTSLTFDKLYQVIKVSESRYIALFVVSESIKNLYSIDCIYIYFPQSLFFANISKYLSFLDIFSMDFPGGKVWGYPTLLIS